MEIISTYVIIAFVVLVHERMAADSTILRMVNLLMALSFGVHREQFEQRTGLTWPRPFLLRPFDARFFTMADMYSGKSAERWQSSKFVVRESLGGTRAECSGQRASMNSSLQYDTGSTRTPRRWARHTKRSTAAARADLQNSRQSCSP